MKSTIISTTSDSISSGGTITGDLTISGDLTVSGSGTYTYDEQIDGQVWIKDSTASSATQGGHLRLFSDDGAALGDTHRLGVLEFGAAEDTSSTITIGARIEAIADAAWSASENGAYLSFYTTDGNDNQLEELRITAPGQVIVSPGAVAGSAAAPQLAFGDGDTGFYEVSDDVVAICAAGSEVFRLDAGGIYGSTTGHPYMIKEVASATNPVFVFKGDTNTGIGTVPGTGDMINLITNSVSRLVLDNNSRISLSNNDSGNYNTVFGYGAGMPTGTNSNNNVIIGHETFDLVANDGAVGNTFVGYRVARGNPTADTDHNVGIGYVALNALTSGDSNVCIGSSAGVGITEEHNVIAIGRNAAATLNDTGADGTVAIGRDALAALTSGAGNTAVGYQSLMTEDANSENTAIGYQSLAVNNGADGNTALGYRAGYDVTTGGGNTFLGAESGANVIGGADNIIIGKGAGSTTTAGLNMVLIGRSAGQAGDITTAATGTVAIGHSALTALTSGASNLAIGYQAADAITSGGYSICIGESAGGALTGSGSNSNIAIGYQALTAATTNAEKNVAIGNQAMYGAWSTAAVDECVAVGYGSMKGVLTADAIGTVAIGSNALTALTSGAGNTAVGYQALDAEDQGNYTTAVGYNAFSALSRNGDVDVYGVAVGYQAGLNVSTGTTNTFIGGLSAGEATGNVLHGAGHACVGYKSGFALSSSAYYNTLMGAYAGDAITTGRGNTLIGYEADTDAATDSYQTRIGHYGALRYMTAQITMDDFTTVADNDAATAPLLKIPQYGFLKRVTCTVVTANGGGTGEYNISLGTDVVAPGTAPAGRIELIGADDTNNTDFIGATFFQSTRSADGDARVNIETAKHVHIWECGQRTDDSSGWTLFEGAGMYLYVCHANASNATDGTNAVLRITAEYWGEN